MNELLVDWEHMHCCNRPEVTLCRTPLVSPAHVNLNKLEAIERLPQFSLSFQNLPIKLLAGPFHTLNLDHKLDIFLFPTKSASCD